MYFPRTLALMLASLAVSAFAAPKEFFVYFGTYTKAPSKGIYRARLDLATGQLSPAELAIEAKDPAFLALHPGGKFLYAIDESSDPKRTPATGLSAYALDPATGALKLLNHQTAGGPGPCHLSVSSDGKAVLVANYGGGSVAAVSLNSDGSLGAVGTFVGVRQESIHVLQRREVIVGLIA